MRTDEFWAVAEKDDNVVVCDEWCDLWVYNLAWGTWTKLTPPDTQIQSRAARCITNEGCGTPNNAGDKDIRMEDKDFEEDRDRDDAECHDLVERRLKAAITLELSRFRYTSVVRTGNEIFPSKVDIREKSLPGHIIQPLTDTFARMILHHDNDDYTAKSIIDTYLGS